MAVEPVQVMETKLQKLSDMLREEGYIPKLDDDGDVSFKAQGRRVVLFADNSDQKFLRLACILNLESQPALKCLQAANEVSKGLKVIKAAVVNETTAYVSAELFFGDMEQFRPVLSRTIEALLSGVQKFWTELEEK